MLLVGFNTICW